MPETRSVPLASRRFIATGLVMAMCENCVWCARQSRKAPPEALRPAMQTMVYGCDICQDVCPWNRRAAVSDAPEWAPREGLDCRTLEDWWEMSDPEIEALIDGTNGGEQILTFKFPEGVVSTKVVCERDR